MRQPKLLSTVGAVALSMSLIAALGVPAHASSVNRVAAFAGTWDVSPGIWAIGFGPPQNGTWRLEADILCVDLEGSGCSLEVEGELGATSSPNGNNIGAWCNGLNRGSGGTGTYTDSQGTIYQVDELGWIITPGQTVAFLTGRWSLGDQKGTVVIQLGPNPSTEVGGCYLQDSDEFAQIGAILALL